MNNYKKVIETYKNDLEDALLACDIWDKKTGLSLESYNPNPKATALFAKISNSFEKSLENLGFPKLSKFIIADLDANSMVVIINLNNNNFMGSIVDTSQVSLGVLINIAIPNVLELFD